MDFNFSKTSRTFMLTHSLRSKLREDREGHCEGRGRISIVITLNKENLYIERGFSPGYIMFKGKTR